MEAYSSLAPRLFETRLDSKGRPTLWPLKDELGVRHCANCGVNLTSRQKSYCNSSVDLVCRHPDCGKAFQAKCDRYWGTREYCSSTCSNTSPIRLAQVKATTLANYGVENAFDIEGVREKAIAASLTPEAIEKKKATNRERYGADWPAQNEELNREYLRRQREKNGGVLAFNTERQKETNRERYGGDSPFSDATVQTKAQTTQKVNNDGKLGFNNDKQRATMLEKYGSAGRLGDPFEMIKQRARMLELYGVETPSEHEPFLEKAMNSLMERYGRIFPGEKISKLNRDFAQELTDRFDVAVEFEHQVQGSFFDLYVPSAKLAIELNPTVTHNSAISFACLRSGCSSFPCNSHTPVASNYHEKRAKLAQSHGLDLLQVFDWDKPEAIFSLLGPKLGVLQKRVSARKTELVGLSQSEANQFLSAHHIQGASSKQIFCYGLKWGGEIIAAATFSRSRFGAHEEWEFNRFAVDRGFRVFGAAGKLFGAFVKEASPSSVVSYVNFNHTTRPQFLNSLGFTALRTTGPALIWNRVRDGKTVSANALHRQGADRLLSTAYGSRADAGLDNRQIMELEGFVPVYTAGNLVLTWLSDSEHTA